jgi:broad specificity phosphatase PhoE
MEPYVHIPTYLKSSMNIVLLRHEERADNDIGVFSKLTENGKKNADSIVLENLSKENIDIIFCSPFIRTIETIYPYCVKNNIKINIEYSICEYLHNRYFIKNEPRYELNDILNNYSTKDLTNIINNTYESLIKKDDLIVLEDEIQLEKRVKNFFDYLKLNYSNKNILIVTHKGVINKIKDLYVEPTNLDTNYEMGSISNFLI